MNWRARAEDNDEADDPRANDEKTSVGRGRRFGAHSSSAPEVGAPGKGATRYKEDGKILRDGGLHLWRVVGVACSCGSRSGSSCTIGVSGCTKQKQMLLKQQTLQLPSLQSPHL